jgi:hypothetical protein
MDRRDNPRRVKVRSLDLRGVPPRLQPVRPGDLGSGGTSFDERDWLRRALRPAGQQTALLVGLAVVAVIVGLAVVAVIVLAYRRSQR